MSLNKIGITALVRSGARLKEIVSSKILKYSTKAMNIIQDNPFSVVAWSSVVALWLSVSLASASIPEKRTLNEIRMPATNIQIFPVTSSPSIKQDWKNITINPDNFWKMSNTWIKNIPNTSSTTLGINIIDSLHFSQETHNKMMAIYGVNANVFLRALTRQETHSWEAMFAQLDLARNTSDANETKLRVWSAVKRIQWVSNAIWLWQITPQFWPLKNVVGPIIVNWNKLKTMIYWVLLYHVNPSLFYSTIKDAKSNSSYKIGLLHKTKKHIENYLIAKGKNKIEVWDIFDILSWIDVRFDNQKMWGIIAQYFVDEYDRLLTTKPHLSKDDAKKLALNRYNAWNNAKIWALYAVSVLSHAKRIAKWNSMLAAWGKPKIAEPQAIDLSDKWKKLMEASITTSLPKVTNSISENPATVQLIHYTNEVANLILASRTVLTWNSTQEERLRKTREQLREIDFLMDQLNQSGLKESFVKTKLEQLWKMKSNLVRQIIELEAIINQTQWNEAYRYGLVV